MQLRIHWAHIDAAGEVVSWGTSNSDDVFRQQLPEGLYCVARPPDANGFGGWKYSGGEWLHEKETSE